MQNRITREANNTVRMLENTVCNQLLNIWRRKPNIRQNRKIGAVIIINVITTSADMNTTDETAIRMIEPAHTQAEPKNPANGTISASIWYSFSEIA